MVLVIKAHLGTIKAVMESQPKTTKHVVVVRLEDDDDSSEYMSVPPAPNGMRMDSSEMLAQRRRVLHNIQVLKGRRRWLLEEADALVPRIEKEIKQYRELEALSRDY